jgi:hypothetical protein
VKFVLFCEGWTETGALPAFLRRWLDAQSLRERVGIQPVRFHGWSQLVEETPRKAPLHLRRPGVIAVIGLLDLHGPTLYPADKTNANQRYDWAKSEIERRVGDPRLRQHFAVHDVEAWILSQPDLLPLAVQKKLPGKAAQPETLNFDLPPANLLDRLYREALGKHYKKRVYGEELFGKLDPNLVRHKCPYFKCLTDDLANLARQAVGTK